MWKRKRNKPSKSTPVANPGSYTSDSYTPIIASGNFVSDTSSPSTSCDTSPSGGDGGCM